MFDFASLYNGANSQFMNGFNNLIGSAGSAINPNMNAISQAAFGMNPQSLQKIFGTGGVNAASDNLRQKLIMQMLAAQGGGGQEQQQDAMAQQPIGSPITQMPMGGNPGLPTRFNTGVGAPPTGAGDPFAGMSNPMSHMPLRRPLGS
jgi:hypothetical protein